MEIRGSGERRSIVLSPSSRKALSDTLRISRISANPAAEEEETVLQGVLRALDLDHDWLDVSVDGTTRRVFGVGETVDDLIGALVNREVRVRVRPGRRGTLLYVDIEPEE